MKPRSTDHLVTEEAVDDRRWKLTGSKMIDASPMAQMRGEPKAELVTVVHSGPPLPNRTTIEVMPVAAAPAIAAKAVEEKDAEIERLAKVANDELQRAVRAEADRDQAIQKERERLLSDEIQEVASKAAATADMFNGDDHRKTIRAAFEAALQEADRG